jgi:hypothetical protein
VNYTQVRIKTEYLEKLKALAAKERRSMAGELEVLIDERIAMQDNNS